MLLKKTFLNHAVIISLALIKCVKSPSSKIEGDFYVKSCVDNWYHWPGWSLLS